MTSKSNGKNKLSGYPDPKKTSMNRWAWEFLRRNPEYRKDVADYLAVCDSIIPRFNPLHPYPHAVSVEDHNRLYSTLNSDERHSVYEPPREPVETEDEWVRRVGKGTITPLIVWYAAKWNLSSSLFDPDAEYNSFHVNFKATAMSVSKAAKGWGGFDDRSKEALIINYNLPLAPQLAVIKTYTEQHRDYLLKLKPRPKEFLPWPEKREQDYLRLLRVLDALQNISDLKFDEQKKKIGDAFYLDTDDSKPSYKRRKAGGEAIKAALKLRDRDYIYLPMMTKKNTK